jgi:hypothetical protein
MAEPKRSVKLNHLGDGAQYPYDEALKLTQAATGTLSSSFLNAAYPRASWKQVPRLCHIKKG